jgi:hypothetical protein
MTSETQQFPVTHELPVLILELPDHTTETYSLFVYDPAVSSLNTEITYKFRVPVTNKSK